MNVRTRRRVGAGVWASGLTVVLVLGALDTGEAEGVGYGFALPVEVAALEAGRVESLPVSLHEMVNADQVVVRFDPSALAADRALATARLLAVQEEAERVAINESRRFMETVEDSEVEHALIAARLTESEAALETLREQEAIEASLVQSGATSVQAVEDWRRDIRVLEARIEADRLALDRAAAAARGAQDRESSVPTGSPWALVAATREIDVIDTRIAHLALTAGIDGQVTWLYRRAGDVVPAGDPVLQVKPRATREVVAFLSPEEAQGRAEGDRASIRRSSGEVLGGTLISVGVGSQVVPAHLWSSPGWPEYGIPVRLLLDSEIGPDERVTVRI